MASSSSSSSISLPSPSLLQTWTHDVFPSFHGEDVRKKFLSHVLKEFKIKGINSFVDNEIKRGEFIGPELERAIIESKIAVVMLSKNYASSSWCLDELVEIMNMKESGQTVIPIFYEVEPTDVKKQGGHFGDAFKGTCQGKTEGKVQKWTNALKGVATIAGYDFSKCDDEATLIENIATEIWNKLMNLLTPSHDFERFIRMEAHMRGMNQLMRLDLDEVRMIGIWGPPGIGKTTIARFLFNQLSGSFQNSAFISGIRRKYPRPCLDRDDEKFKLQEEMLSKMFNKKDIVIPHLGVVQQRLRHMKVLLVLDDVDQLPQLQALAENVQWFGPRSRIIIITEDHRLLKAHKVEHIYTVEHICTVSFASDDEALEMFCKYAFNKKTPEDGFDALAREITYIVGELPLALEVIGSHFRGLSKKEWSMEVSRLRTNYIDGDIESFLKFSYDTLSEEDKDLFLHIACIFNYMDMEKVVEYLAESFDHVDQRLQVLADKSLISIEFIQSNVHQTIIRMHAMLAQLGQKIVQSGKLGERRLLFDHKDIHEVMIDNTTMTRSVVGIYSKDQLKVPEKAFERMFSLQFLIVNPFRVHRYRLLDLRFHRLPDCSDFSMTSVDITTGLLFRVGLKKFKSYISSLGTLRFRCPNLRLLHWSYFPMTSLRFMNDDLEFLVELYMICSKLVKLWDGTKLLRNLKWMNLEISENLKKLPNLSTATNLKELNLSGCSSLVELPSSIGNATSLKFLDLAFCSSLVELPYSIGNLANLKELNLCCCSILVELPSSIVNATSLHDLDLRNCSNLVSLPQLPDSLRYLDAGNCESLEKLDWSFCNPGIMLHFGNCFKLNKEARDLLIEKSTVKLVVVPGKEVPACFTYRGYGSSVTVKLNQKHLPSSTKFKACVLFEEKVPYMSWDTICAYTKKNKEQGSVSCCIRDDNMDARGEDIPILTEHLYIFEVAVEEVTSTELVFDFSYSSWDSDRTNEIKECGIIQLLEHHVDEDYEMTK